MTFVRRIYVSDGEVEGLGYTVVAAAPDTDRIQGVPVDVDLTREQEAQACAAFKTYREETAHGEDRMNEGREMIDAAHEKYMRATAWLPPLYRAACDAQHGLLKKGGA